MIRETRTAIGWWLERRQVWGRSDERKCFDW